MKENKKDQSVLENKNESSKSNQGKSSNPPQKSHSIVNENDEITDTQKEVKDKEHQHEYKNPTVTSNRKDENGSKNGKSTGESAKNENSSLNSSKSSNKGSDKKS